MYPEGEYDLAGFAVGIVEKSRIIDGRRICAGDAVLGLASSGPHSNGYSLIRKVIEVAGADLYADFHGRPLGEVLLEPTRIYVKPLLALMKTVKVKGMAHITGGGLLENVPRILHEDLAAVLGKHAWEMPPVFQWLMEAGKVAEQEMYRTFNCGIGMVVVVDNADVEVASKFLSEQGETVYHLGAIVSRANDQPQTVVV
jgi:phosphoribosylformylglycinamidine cyclo-ligase